MSIHIQVVKDDLYDATPTRTFCGVLIPGNQTLSQTGWWPREDAICAGCLERARQANPDLRPRRIKWLGGPGGELRQCSECENVTRYWAVDEDVPLCDVCARRGGE